MTAKEYFIQLEGMRLYIFPLWTGDLRNYTIAPFWKMLLFRVMHRHWKHRRVYYVSDDLAMNADFDLNKVKWLVGKV